MLKKDRGRTTESKTSLLFIAKLHILSLRSLSTPSSAENMLRSENTPAHEALQPAGATLIEACTDGTPGRDGAGTKALCQILLVRALRIQ